jgi:hypothetical protein
MGNRWFKGNPYFNRVSSNATKAGTTIYIFGLISVMM